MKNTKKILVTGGAGFIGSNLVDRLIKQGHEVTVLDNLVTGKEENINSDANFVKADISDRVEIEKSFENIDYVFHLAALARVPLSIEDPAGTAKVNILGTINVFKCAADNRVKRVIFASSSSVYGDQEVLPLAESMKPAPISPYALEKLEGELWAGMFTDLYELPVVSLRFFNIYGPRNDPDSDYSLVIAKFLKQKSLGQPLTIFGDGEQTRGFCYIDDLTKALIASIESEKIKGGEVINIGSQTANSVNQLADLIGGEKRYLDKRSGDMQNSKADITRAIELLDWRPEVIFEEGVKRTKEWFQGYEANNN